MLEAGLFKWADIKTITLAKSGKLWLGTSQGLASFDGNDMVYMSHFNNRQSIKDYQRIERFVDDGIGHLWFATQDSVVKLNLTTGNTFANPLPFFDSGKTGKKYAGYNPFLDSDGNLWLALGDNGFVIYDTAKHSFDHYNFDATKPAAWADHYKNNAYFFMQDPVNENKIWIAGYGSGIYMFDKNKKKVSKNFHAANGKDSCWTNTAVTMLDARKDGVIWYSTWGNGMGEYDMRTGLYKVHPTDGYFFSVENGLRELFSGGSIPHFCRKSDSEYYVARMDTLPAVFNIRTQKYSFINDATLNKTLPRTVDIKTDVKGNIWCLKGGRLFISSPRYQLFKYIPFTNPKPVSRDGIELRDIVWDSINHIYYAAVQFSQGIYVLDSNFKTIRMISIPYSFGRDGVTGAALVWRVRKDKKERMKKKG